VSITTPQGASPVQSQIPHVASPSVERPASAPLNLAAKGRRSKAWRLTCSGCGNSCLLYMPPLAKDRGICPRCQRLATVTVCR
jgi:hypothetical protein